MLKHFVKCDMVTVTTLTMCMTLFFHLLGVCRALLAASHYRCRRLREAEANEAKRERARRCTVS